MKIPEISRKIKKFQEKSRNFKKNQEISRKIKKFHEKSGFRMLIE
jgi:hypothetical protein